MYIQYKLNDLYLKKFSILTNTHLYSLLDLVRHKIGRKNPNLVKDGINR